MNEEFISVAKRQRVGRLGLELPGSMLLSPSQYSTGHSPPCIPLVINSSGLQSPVMLGSPKTNAPGRTKRNETALAIASTHFEPLLDASSKGMLLDRIIELVAGKDGFERMRLGLAALDSLQKFEIMAHTESRLNYGTSDLVIGAHMATLPDAKLKLDSAYSRLTGLHHMHIPKIRERLCNPDSFYSSTGLFQYKPRGLAKTKAVCKEHAIAFWKRNAQPRMLGSGTSRCRVSLLHVLWLLGPCRLLRLL